MVFSGLDSTVAGDVEESFAKAGHLVVSNAKNHRMAEDVPLLIPEINSDHLGLLEKCEPRKPLIIGHLSLSVTACSVPRCSVQLLTGNVCAGSISE